MMLRKMLLAGFPLAATAAALAQDNANDGGLLGGLGLVGLLVVGVIIFVLFNFFFRG